MNFIAGSVTLLSNCRHGDVAGWIDFHRFETPILYTVTAASAAYGVEVCAIWQVNVPQYVGASIKVADNAKGSGT